jgi:predicted ester cyclase
MNTGNTDKLREFVADDFIDGYFTAARGVEVMQQHINAVRSTYPDLAVEITQQLADGDYVISFFVARGTHLGEWLKIKPTGKRVEITGVNIDKVVGGKIVEHRGHADTFEALMGIGAIQPS